MHRKPISAELHWIGHEARLESGDGHFYFLGLEPATPGGTPGRTPI